MCLDPTISTDISFQIKRVKLFYFCQAGEKASSQK